MAISAANRIRAERPAEIRRRNERIARAAAAHRFGDTAPVPFLCECSDTACVELVRMSLPQYHDVRDTADFFATPGHDVDGAAVVRARDHCRPYRAQP